MTNIGSIEFYKSKFDWLIGIGKNEFVLQLINPVNLLNIFYKETANKTTSEVINEGKLRESEILLRHSNWNFNEIGLRILEVKHINNFFKKNLNTTHLKFRKGIYE